MSLNCFGINKYEKIHSELKNLLNMLGILLKTFLKSETVISMRTSIPKIAECYLFSINCSGIFWEQRYFCTILFKQKMWLFKEKRG